MSSNQCKNCVYAIHNGLCAYGFVNGLDESNLQANETEYCAGQTYREQADKTTMAKVQMASEYYRSRQRIEQQSDSLKIVCFSAAFAGCCVLAYLIVEIIKHFIL